MKQTRNKHIFHLRRLGLFGVLFVAFFVVRFDAGAITPGSWNSGKVLAYASEMSRSGLLSGTNSARSANGLAPLTLNSQLNSAAQAKAQHMADLDYWAHVAPDGTEPWYFFEQAGYAYVRAGENLAYGFSTSQGTVDGWMNSSSHRANILGDYADVGFGIVNAPNYQSSGQQTIVVAHYGTKAMAPPAPATAEPAPTAPQAAPTPSETLAAPAPTAPEPATATPAPSDSSTEQPEASSPEREKDTSEVAAAAPAVNTGSTERVSVLGMIATRTLPIAALTSLSMVFVAIIGYAMTHRAAMQHAFGAGEHFVMTHPGVDAGVVAMMTALIVLTTYGNIG